jgi:hypothetical protein
MIAMRTDGHFARSCTRARRRRRDTQCWKRNCDKEQQQENDEWSRGTHSVYTYDATPDNSDANSWRSTVWNSCSRYAADIGHRHVEIESDEKIS